MDNLHWLERMTIGPLPGDVSKWVRVADQICRNSHWYAYWRLIDKARKRTPPSKVDRKNFHRHHVLPKCLLIEDEKTELVWLTHVEHFEAHILLVWISRNDFLYRKMLAGLSKVTHGKKEKCSKRQMQAIGLALSTASKDMWADVEYRDRMTTILRTIGKTQSSRRKALWKDPEYLAKMAARQSGCRSGDPAQREIRRAQTKARHQIPEEHGRLVSGLIAHNKSPEGRRIVGNATRARYKDPIFRKMMGDVIKIGLARKQLKN